jgi:hypothetical protein
MERIRNLDVNSIEYWDLSKIKKVAVVNSRQCDVDRMRSSSTFPYYDYYLMNDWSVQIHYKTFL